MIYRKIIGIVIGAALGLLIGYLSSCAGSGGVG
jgi:hypothetical protein